jgi:hypothetical protein
MLFMETVPVYTESYTKHLIQNAASMTVKVDGTYSYRSALNG